jgi:hypothetical protein
MLIRRHVTAANEHESMLLDRRGQSLVVSAITDIEADDLDTGGRQGNELHHFLPVRPKPPDASIILDSVDIDNRRLHRLRCRTGSYR